MVSMKLMLVAVLSVLVTRKIVDASLASDDLARFNMVQELFEEMSDSSVMKIPVQMIKEMPADVFVKVWDQQGGVAKSRSWVKNAALREKLFDTKNVQTMQQIFGVIEGMSPAEQKKVDWVLVKKSLPSDAFAKMPRETYKHMNWKAIWPLLRGQDIRQMPIPSIKQIPPSAWKYITSDAMSEFTLEQFGEIPIESIAQVPGSSFKEVAMVNWRQLGPFKFSKLKNDAYGHITKGTYEALGRPFLSRVSKDKIAIIQRLLPNLRPLPYTRTKSFITEVDSRDEISKLEGSIRALTHVMSLSEKPVNVDVYKHAPHSSLATINSKAIQALGSKRFTEQRERIIQSMARKLFFHMSKEDIDSVDWSTVTEVIDVQTFNSFSPKIIENVKWEEVMKTMSVEKFGKLTPRFCKRMPAKVFKGLTKEHIRVLKPSVIRVLSVEQLNNIPSDAFGAFSAEQLESISVEKLRQLDSTKFKRIDWVKYIETKDVSKVNEFTPQMIKSLNWNRMFSKMKASDIKKLDIRTLRSIDGRQFRSFTSEQFKALPDDFIKSMSISQMRGFPPQAFNGIDKERLVLFSEEQFTSMTKAQREGFNWAELMKSMESKDWNQLSNKFIQAMPDSALSDITPEKLMVLDQRVLENVPANTLRRMNWSEMIKKMDVETFGRFSERVFQNMPPSAFSEFSEDQFIQMPPKVFKYFSAEQLKAFPKEYYSRIDAAKLRAIGPIKLLELRSYSGDQIPIAALTEAGEDYLLAVDRVGEGRASKIATESRAFEIKSERLFNALEGTSGEAPRAVFLSMTEQEFRQLDWKKVAPVIRSYHINALDERTISRIPFGEMWSLMRRSSIRGLSKKSWSSIPSKEYGTLTAQEVEVIAPATISTWSQDVFTTQLKEEVFTVITERTLVRMGEQKFGMLEVSQLSRVDPKHFELVPPGHWTALGEDKFFALPKEIQESVTSTTRAKVYFLEKKDEEDGQNGNDGNDEKDEKDESEEKLTTTPSVSSTTTTSRRPIEVKTEVKVVTDAPLTKEEEEELREKFPDLVENGGLENLAPGVKVFSATCTGKGGCWAKP